MRVPIQMPQLGESIAEATVVEIDISADIVVETDQEIFQVETNKAMMGVTTPCAGKILEIVAVAGESYAVGGDARISRSHRRRRATRRTDSGTKYSRCRTSPRR